MFQLKKCDGLARLGVFDTAHGKIETPTLLPVLNPSKMPVPPSEMQSRFNVQAVITNSYIIHRSEAMREKALSEGVHKLIGADMPVMTDSGTFQSHVYGTVHIGNREIVEFQRAIGSDIGTVLDLFSEPHEPVDVVEDAWKVTLERTKEAAGIKGDMLLSGVVQGGVHPHLRERFARDLRDVPVDVHPIGGVVPLMESYRYPDLVRAVLASKRGLDPSRPVHLFGAGHPMLFALAVLMGCDLFDSSSYAKFARDGRMMFLDGTRHIEDMEELPCNCPACSGFTVKELMKDPESERWLALHNLYTCFQELREVREAVRRGRLWELVECRVKGHPAMGGVLEALQSHDDLFELREPNWRNGPFMHLGAESFDRPLAKRVRAKLASPVPENAEVLPFRHERNPLEDGHEFARMAGNGVPLMVRTYYGLAPHGLLSTYPFGQTVMPKELDAPTITRLQELWKAGPEPAPAKELPVATHPGTAGNAALAGEKGVGEDYIRGVVAQVCDFQFGPGAGAALTGGDLGLAFSKRTGKLRRVMLGGQHVLSLRAREGLFTLKPEGARLLLAALPAPRLRIVVSDDSAEFNRTGKNVFPQFIQQCDPGLRPADDAIVVDPAGKYVAVGRLVLAPEDMKFFKGGVAVKIHRGQDEEPE